MNIYGVNVQKRVVMATMGLHNYIKISNFSDADFVYNLTQVTQTQLAVADREHMAQIRDNIADMLW
ncbi:unnamed protein product [Thlaspi arvense]|uniref:Uncharacterized protein n=1 Tax=Thlaspi arvense TaxID=13288 RepID=A0AAU9RSV5_THLAR|nr:unnamed protein product [Thlaspi arvense]